MEAVFAQARDNDETEGVRGRSLICPARSYVSLMLL